MESACVEQQARERGRNKDIERKSEEARDIDWKREVNKRTSEPLHNKMALTAAGNNNKEQQQKSCNL